LTLSERIAKCFRDALGAIVLIETWVDESGGWFCVSEVLIISTLAMRRSLSRPSRGRVGVGEAPGENPSICYRGHT
jgi:hypothetical protein